MTAPSASSPAPFGRFFLPGPTEVRAEVLAAQVGEMFAHRGSSMRELMTVLQMGLREVFLTERPVYIAPASGTGMMEGAIRNGVARRVLCLVNGAFSERFAAIADACGKEVERLEVPWGEVHEPGMVSRRLAEGSYDAVTLVHSETSTGALQPVAELARVIREGSDALVMVDSVSGLGGAPMKTDEWGLDFVLTGSQKALALPPGLAFGVASTRMVERAASIPDRGFYFDLVRFDDEASELQTPTTPALTLLFALRHQLERIKAEGMQERWVRHQAMAQRCWAWVERVTGLDVLAARAVRSPTVTCVRLPEGLPGSMIVEGMAKRGFVIGSGYGKLKPSTFRIGHMGEHTVVELDELLQALEGVLDDAGVKR